MMKELDTLMELAKNGNKDAARMLINITENAFDEEETELNRQLEIMLPLVLMFSVSSITKSKPKYMQLHPQLKVFEKDTLFLYARDQGRFWYRMDQYHLDDETNEAVRAPKIYARQEIFDYIDVTIRIPGDARLFATIPLAFRVGVVVGYLSALAITQREDAQAGMVMLTALVVPLLTSQVLGKSTSSQPCPTKQLKAPSSSSKRTTSRARK